MNLKVTDNHCVRKMVLFVLVFLKKIKMSKLKFTFPIIMHFEGYT